MKKYLVTIGMLFVLLNSCVNAEDLNQQLWNTVRNGTLQEVKELLDKGADPNIHGASYGATCLMVAAFNGSIDKMKLLLKYGANINGTHNGKGNILAKGDNAFNNAIVGYYFNKNKKAEDAAIFLVNNGINEKDRLGLTWLMNSSREGLLKLTNHLISKEVDVNALTSENYSALSIACLKCQTEIVKILLKYGAKTDIKITEGKHKGLTALDIAKKKGCSEIVHILENHQKQ